MALPWALLLLGEVLAQDAAAQSCLLPPAAPFNVALGRPASQSSSFPNLSIATNAVDGNRDGVWQHGSCAHTLAEREPWWSVDLGGRQAVAAVLVKNRQDCCWKRLRGAQVHVGDAPAERSRDNPICGTITDAGPGSLSTICCHGLPGRYVSILLPGREDALVLCEVEVVLQGCLPLPGAPNAARGRAVAQSSTLDDISSAVNAVDGDSNTNWERGSCTRTERESEPWWRVDLGHRHAIYAVTVTNRHDCCWESLLGAQVHVGDSLDDHGKRNPVCGTILDAGPGSRSTVCCAGLPGRYVSVIIPGREDSLVLCEVEVTAQSCHPPPGAVVVRNRLDCCWHQLKGAHVHVGDNLAGHGTTNPICGSITDTGPGSTSTVCCRGLRGRYVTIAVPGREEQLSLCEVEVVEQGCAVLPGAQNVALGRPATQSSVLDAGSSASNAVDGNQDGDWEHGSCAHTMEEPEPWWRVDLGHWHVVYAVVVKNRHDCCWESLKGAEVHVGNSLVDRGRRNPVCGVIADAGPGSLSTICCHGLRGRYVTILIPDREDTLALCEVEVIRQGCGPLPGAPNVAREQQATQSSTSNGAGVAANAVDGNRDGIWQHGSCSHTRREREPWWSVDLGGRQAVAAVLVKNRQDCCWERLWGAQVHVGDAPAKHSRDNPICGTITDAGPGSLSTVCCHGLPGRYVTVTIPGREEVLTLCEVEVYGGFSEL